VKIPYRGIHFPQGLLEEGCGVIDPVCGMEVTSEDAAAAWPHAGTTYYFCSVGCMERFRADPERFLSAATDGRSM
jgi:Cu+-exporting ATPase